MDRDWFALFLEVDFACLVAAFIWFFLSAAAQLLYRIHQDFFPSKRGRELSAALRSRCVEGLHNRPWDCWDSWEVQEDKYNSEPAQILRRVGGSIKMKWNRNYWKKWR